PRESGDLLVDHGVVLHRARAQRIHGGRRAQVPLRQTDVVPQHLELPHLGKTRQVVLAGEAGRERMPRPREPSTRTISRPPGRPAFEDERLTKHQDLTARPTTSTRRSSCASSCSSVTQTSKPSDRSGYHRPSGNPGTMPLVATASSQRAAIAGTSMTNSLKNGPDSTRPAPLA